MGILDCKQIVDDYNRQNNTNFFYYPIFTKTYPEGYTSQIQASTNERWKPDHVKSLMYAMFYHDDDREDAGANKNQIEEATEIRYFLTKDRDDSFPEYFENFDDDYQNEIKEKVKQYGNPDLIVSGYFTALETAILYHLNQRGDDFSRNGGFRESGRFGTQRDPPGTAGFSWAATAGPTQRLRYRRISSSLRGGVPGETKNDCIVRSRYSTSSPSEASSYP